MCCVCFWHQAAVEETPINVRFRAMSGHDAMAHASSSPVLIFFGNNNSFCLRTSSDENSRGHPVVTQRKTMVAVDNSG
jgi:hypothetical protein